MFDKVVVFGSHGRFTFASPALVAVKRYGIAFDISPVGNADHHILFDNHIFNTDFFGFLNNFHVPLIAEIRLYPVEFVFYNVEHESFVG